jgi:hypothetical protein
MADEIKDEVAAVEALAFIVESVCNPVANGQDPYEVWRSDSSVRTKARARARLIVTSMDTNGLCLDVKAKKALVYCIKELTTIPAKPAYKLPEE